MQSTSTTMPSRRSILYAGLSLAGISALVWIGVVIGTRFMPGSEFSYGDQAAAASSTAGSKGASTKIQVSHLAVPESVRGVYISACTASEKYLRDRVLATIADTDVNAIVIDVKDYSGTISTELPGVDAPPGGKGCRVSDMPEFLAELHEKGIYAIARVTVFQDPLYASIHPDIAVQSIARPGKPWADKNGLAFIDPNFPAYWHYIVSIAKGAHAIGFDEINFDYIRFPSDGNMADAQFAIPAGGSRALSIKNFFSFLHSELAPLGIVTSADIFGQTTVNYDDLGIGQILENTLPYFDYVAPMNYPSHYIKGFMGFPNPATNPYEVIKGTMMLAVERAIAASSSPAKLRPWLQAFDLGAVYTSQMVRAQIQALSDVGVTSWLLWDAANRYKKEALR